ITDVSKVIDGRGRRDRWLRSLRIQEPVRSWQAIGARHSFVARITVHGAEDSWFMSGEQIRWKMPVNGACNAVNWLIQSYYRIAGYSRQAFFASKPSNRTAPARKDRKNSPAER